MTESQAKRASYILQKINQYEELIHNLTYSETHNIKFGKLHEINNFILLDKEIVDEIVLHCIFSLKERILILSKQLKTYKQMTPKEKAKELIDSFLHHTRPYNKNYNYIDCTEKNVNDWEFYYSAINCALIAADEIIEIIHSEGTLISYGYWNDVKQELLNLKKNK
jgi:hypothetical protein